MDRVRILIVDDEVGFTRMLKLALERLNRYEVHEEHRGGGAVGAARAVRPDLILLDLVMPDMEGSQVAELLKADPELRTIPVVFLTALVSKAEAQTYQGMIGGQPFLAKPVQIDELVACIERRLEGANG